MYLKIILAGLVMFSTALSYNRTCYAAGLDMKTYCARTSSVSFPATGIYENINRPQGYDEAYLYIDKENFITYQFFLKRIAPEFRSQRYLESVASAKVEALKAQFTSKRFMNVNSKFILDYSYEYFFDGVKKSSYTRTIIENDAYYSWTVQSNEGYGKYVSKYIFDNYVMYVGNAGRCK